MNTKSFLAALAMAVTLPALATPVYTNNFESGLGPSVGGYAILTGTEGYAAFGYGNQFMRNDAGGNPAAPTVVSLNLGSAVNNATLNLDLAIIDSWDGANCCGPDFFNVSVDGTTIYTKNFSVFDGPSVGPELSLKSYGSNLGFNSGWNDQAYGLNLNLGNLTAGNHTLAFFASGNGWQAGWDESWGIDNLVVAGDPVRSNVPEPVSAALLLAGIGALAAVRRRAA